MYTIQHTKYYEPIMLELTRVKRLTILAGDGTLDQHESMALFETRAQIAKATRALNKLYGDYASEFAHIPADLEDLPKCYPDYLSQLAGAKSSIWEAISFFRRNLAIELDDCYNPHEVHSLLKSSVKITDSLMKAVTDLTNANSVARP